ncbi:glycosyltransferase [Paenisporosarcina macmurdoensis]|uniref:Glycosyltransferase n=1 Tax=Paenisporosarcina macmurdoensis TaxID=212659 RepID=A0ABW1L6P4_9BACL
MRTITLCMIVKNEEDVLYQCLNSIKEICDEMIIVDTGSTDKTKEIAKQFTEKVIDFKWIDDFSAARNIAFGHATMDYILWLDADDILLIKDQKKFKNLKTTLDSSFDAYSMIYNVAFDEFDNPTFSFRRNRLVKREKNFKWVGPVHEYLDVHGNIFPADIVITHRKTDKKNQSIQSDRNLKIYEKRLEKGEEFTPRDLFYYANELKEHAQFQKSISFYENFLATKKGWIEDEIRACINMAISYRNLGNAEKEKESLVISFMYDLPRPEVTCRLGDIYTNKRDFKKAIKWYRLALEIEEEDHQGFRQISYSTWYPHLQLCYCFWEIGDVEQSLKHHKISIKYRPNDTNVKKNEEFFRTYFKNRKK